MINDILLMTGDAEARMHDLPDRSVNAIVTSPPYFGLRKYNAEGEVGLERSPGDYIDRLVSIFREAHRVLRDDGSCWIVIGDSYANDSKWGGSTSGKHGSALHGDTGVGREKRNTGCKAKELIGIPWRLAFALSDDGWYRRQVIVWQKPNCFAESIKDRCTMAHEFILHMTKSTSYYHDWFAIAEPAVSSHGSGNGFKREGYVTRQNADGSPRGNDETWTDIGGIRNARSVWTINVEPSYLKHTAMFPTRLASRVIQASTPEGGCCPECFAPMRRLLSKGEADEAWQKACGADTSGGYSGVSQKDYKAEKAQDASATKARILAGLRKRETIGWQKTCGCSTTGNPVPAVVLDPFCGAGTSMLSATRLGRDGIGIDLKLEYNDMAAMRIADQNAKCLDGAASKLPFRQPRIQRA